MVRREAGKARYSDFEPAPIVSNLRTTLNLNLFIYGLSLDSLAEQVGRKVSTSVGPGDCQTSKKFLVCRKF